MFYVCPRNFDITCVLEWKHGDAYTSKYHIIPLRLQVRYCGTSIALKLTYVVEFSVYGSAEQCCKWNTADQVDAFFFTYFTSSHDIILCSLRGRRHVHVFERKKNTSKYVCMICVLRTYDKTIARDNCVPQVECIDLLANTDPHTKNRKTHVCL